MFGFFSKKRQESELKKLSIDFNEIDIDMRLRVDPWLRYAKIHVDAIENKGYDLDSAIDYGLEKFFSISSKCGAPDISYQEFNIAKICIFARVIEMTGSGHYLASMRGIRKTHGIDIGKDDSHALHLEISSTLNRVLGMICQDKNYPSLIGKERGSGNDVWVAKNKDSEFTALIMTSSETGEIDYQMAKKEYVAAILEQIERRNKELFTTQATL